MASDASRAAGRTKALERAARRARAAYESVAAVDSRVSFARLAGSVVYLAVLASFFARWDVVGKTLGILSFVAFFVILSRLHARLQARVSLWRACVASYEVSLLRWTRDFEALARRHAPWHAEIAREIPKGHVYAHDLDVPRQVFGLLDAASCVEGSRLLFDRLLNCALPAGAGAGSSEKGTREHPSPSDAIALLARRLVPLTPLHRRLEALRLQEETLQEYHAYREDGHEKVFERAAERFAQGLPTGVRLGFAGLGVAAWFVFLLPAWREFLLTARFEPLFTGLTKYALFPLLGLVIFAPVLEAARLLSRKSRVLLALCEAMGGSHVRGAPAPESEASSDVSPLAATQKDAGTVVCRLRSLQRALTLLEMRGNPVLWLFLHVLVPYDALAAAWLEWRARQALPRLPTWWQGAVRFDVAVQLARFAWENPDFRFIEPRGAGPEFHVEGLGHPALPADKRVNNDLSLAATRPVVLLTGSNMAGKSTFLRTLGVNVVLARAGGPVCARVFRCPVEEVYCAIRVDDSLEEATSYFYAEVKRLQGILERLSDPAAVPFRGLFLIDEIFRGTNNRERFLGSWHVIRAFLSTRSYGIVSTHDLALCALEERDPRLVNMHFREHVEEGRLAFDYLLRPGPCPTTNALFIMRHSGLPIPDEPEVADVRMSQAPA